MTQKDKCLYKVFFKAYKKQQVGQIKRKDFLLYTHFILFYIIIIYINVLEYFYAALCQTCNCPNTDQVPRASSHKIMHEH